MYNDFNTNKNIKIFKYTCIGVYDILVYIYIFQNKN